MAITAPNMSSFAGPQATSPMMQTDPANLLMAAAQMHQQLGGGDPTRSAPVPRGQPLQTGKRLRPPRHAMKVVK